MCNVVVTKVPGHKRGSLNPFIDDLERLNEAIHTSRAVPSIHHIISYIIFHISSIILHIVV